MGKYVEKATKFIAVINSQLNGCVVSMEDYYRGVFPWQSAYESMEHVLTNVNVH
jgi:hypothetical protein